MASNKKIVYLALILLVMSSFLENEVEARRKILRGRKTITRTYYRGLEIPGWVTVIIASIFILAINTVVFFVLKKWMILSNEPQPPAAPYRMEHEV